MYPEIGYMRAAAIRLTADVQDAINRIPADSSYERRALNMLPERVQALFREALDFCEALNIDLDALRAEDEDAADHPA